MTLELISHGPDALIRGRTSLTVGEGEHRWTFHALDFPRSVDPLEWAAGQVLAMTDRDRAINCEHCPDAGEPTVKEASDGTDG